MSDDSEWGFPNRATPFGSASYYAVRFSPPDQRERNARLLAWFQLIRETAVRPADPGAARLKLDWWRTEVDRMLWGTARHPLAVLLQEEFGAGQEGATALQEIIDATEDEIMAPRLPDDAAFASACRRTTGSLFRLFHCLDGDPQQDEDRCREAGAYCAAVERVRRLAVDPQRVPVDLSVAGLIRMPAVGRARRLEALLGLFDVAPGGEKGSALPDLARRLTALGKAVHNKMRNRGYPVADTLIDRAPIAKLWTAWRGS